MPALTPSFTFDLESNMRMISEESYKRLNANSWWMKVAKELMTRSKKERISWLLDTAGINYTSRLGGEVEYDDIVSNTTEFEYKAATAGLKLNRYQLEDHDGKGVDLAGHWARGIGSYAAYWPQKQVAATLLAGEAAGSLAYDGEVFFSAAHPLNQFDAPAGTYANIFTGAAVGAYPGALPIDDSVSLDVAMQNIGKALAYIAQIKQPNGADPRNLRARAILHPASLTTRVSQLLGAKFIAQDSTSAGGSADVEAVIARWGMAEPIEAVEVGAGFPSGSDTSYYLVTEDIGSDSLGAIVYVNREPFQVNFHDGVSQVELNRDNGLEWICRGANNTGYGHPYLVFKAKAA